MIIWSSNKNYVWSDNELSDHFFTDQGLFFEKRFSKACLNNESFEIYPTVFHDEIPVNMVYVYEVKTEPFVNNLTQVTSKDLNLNTLKITFLNDYNYDYKILEPLKNLECFIFSESDLINIYIANDLTDEELIKLCKTFKHDYKHNTELFFADTEFSFIDEGELKLPKTRLIIQTIDNPCVQSFWRKADLMCELEKPLN